MSGIVLGDSMKRELALEKARGHGCCPDPDCGHAWAAHGENGCFVKNGHDEYCSCSAVPAGVTAFLAEERRQAVLKKPCPDHPRYAVLRKPRTACERCWRMWLKVKP